jgi:hypothetical protein
VRNAPSREQERLRRTAVTTTTSTTVPTRAEVLRNQIAQKEKALATAQETVSRLKAGIRALVKRLQELAMAEWGK